MLWAWFIIGLFMGWISSACLFTVAPELAQTLHEHYQQWLDGR